MSDGLALNSALFDLSSVLPTLAAGIALMMFVPRFRRLRSTLRSRSWLPGFSRALSRWVKTRECSEADFLAADGAAPCYIEARQRGLRRLREECASRSTASTAWVEALRGGLSDLRFADASRVPFPFAQVMREGFNVASIAVASQGSRLLDLDGNWNVDVSGSYGVNLAGYDRYKEWLDRGWAKVRDLGPVLGPLHPLVADNIARLQRISGLDEVSFHASGTEAVMAATRLARFNTERKQIVCFAGAYHGWWDGVQPGLGSERDIDDCLTLKDLHPPSLETIRLRARDIAGVLVNPVQSFHPNSPPPNDAVLLNSSVRQTVSDTSAYATWLKQLREVCTAAGVPLIFDEVFSGFRLHPGGAQALYDVRADMVVYGKTVAGGMPIGVVCGTHPLMRRFDPKRPMRMAYVVGTFAAHPLAMGTMSEFLDWVEAPETAAEHDRASERAQRWVTESNAVFEAAGLPVHVSNLATIWTIQFNRPSRYNWLLQYYLRAQGINLSWVGTGRCMFNLAFSEADYAHLTDAIVRASTRMQQDKWWLADTEHPHLARDVKRGVARDLARSLLVPPRPLHAFYGEVMRRKHDDHVASHSNRTNQLLHLLSSSTFLFCYATVLSDLVTAMWLGLAALFVRQIGHALIEPPCHDKEQLLLGFDTRSKTKVVGIYLLIPVLNCVAATSINWSTAPALITNVAEQWLVFTAIIVFGHTARLVPKHGLRNALIWLVKLVTDPITDIGAYYPTVLRLRRNA